MRRLAMTVMRAEARDNLIISCDGVKIEFIASVSLLRFIFPDMVTDNPAPLGFGLVSLRSASIWPVSLWRTLIRPVTLCHIVSTRER